MIPAPDKRLRFDPGSLGLKGARRSFFRRDTVAVARDLIGAWFSRLHRGSWYGGRIVETEAYRGPADRASHAYGGRRTRRTETMYRIGGTSYVYFVYGMYYQFNVVTNAAEIPHAVLVRALEPAEGIEVMRERRGGQPDHNLTNGPGKLCIALAIDRALDDADLLGDRVWIEARRRVPARAVAVGSRVGIDYAGEWVAKPWRFWIRDSPYVSR